MNNLKWSDRNKNNKAVKAMSVRANGGHFVPVKPVSVNAK